MGDLLWTNPQVVWEFPYSDQWEPEQDNQTDPRWPITGLIFLVIAGTEQVPGPELSMEAPHCLKIRNKLCAQHKNPRPFNGSAHRNQRQSRFIIFNCNFFNLDQSRIIIINLFICQSGPVQIWKFESNQRESKNRIQHNLPAFEHLWILLGTKLFFLQQQQKLWKRGRPTPSCFFSETFPYNCGFQEKYGRGNSIWKNSRFDKVFGMEGFSKIDI